MPVVERADQSIEEWRPGVRTRLLASAATDAKSLCLFEQWSDPGCGAPTHMHPGTEEVLVLLDGHADVWIAGTSFDVEQGASFVVPPHTWHGFRNSGSGVLHTLAAFADASPDVRYEGAPDEVLTIGAVRGGAHRSRRATERTE